MTHPCAVPGCRKAVTGHSRYCPTHLKTKQRWGHPTQTPMSQGEVDKAAARVRQLIDRRPKAAAIWESLRAIATTLRKDAAGTVREWNANAVMAGTVNAPAVAIFDVLGEVDHDKVISSMVAISFISEIDRSRFRDDNAFFATAARRFLALGRSQYKSHVNTKTGQRTRTLKDMKPKFALALGRHLMAAFGPFGIALHAHAVKTADETRSQVRAPINLLEDES